VFAQILLGIVFIGMGISHLLKIKTFVSNRILDKLGKNEIEKYQKGLIFPHVMIGVIFIIMGIIENKEILQTPVFVGLYIILAIFPLSMILLNNKKYTDSYSPF